MPACRNGFRLPGKLRRQTRPSAAPFPLALAAATLWVLHPLQTESVSFVVQRTESLMGLFFLLTVYCFVRGTDSRFPRGWHALALSGCLLGMATKEVMVAAPLL